MQYAPPSSGTKHDISTKRADIQYTVRNEESERFPYRYAPCMWHDLAVLPNRKHKNGYECLITTNPGPNGLTGIDERSRLGTLTKMSSLTASSNSY